MQALDEQTLVIGTRERTLEDNKDLIHAAESQVLDRLDLVERQLRVEQRVVVSFEVAQRRGRDHEIAHELLALARVSIEHVELAMSRIHRPRDALALALELERVRRNLREERVDETRVAVFQARELIAIEVLVLVPADSAQPPQVLAARLQTLLVQTRPVDALHELDVQARVVR